MVIDPNETPITDEQAELINEWLEANAKAPGWLDGYGLGGSYIDTRVKAGAKTDGRQSYVDLDHGIAEKVPELRGYRASDIREYMVVRTALGRAPGAR